jgi:Arc/MetJ family transcription regulator
MMPRTTVNVDQELLDASRRALDTSGVAETINAALAATARQARLAAFDVRDFDVTDADVDHARADRAPTR